MNDLYKGRLVEATQEGKFLRRGKTYRVEGYTRNLRGRRQITLHEMTNSYPPRTLVNVDPEVLKPL